MQLEMMKNYRHVATEIPPGQPQVEYFNEGGYWTPRDDVVRCVISDGDDDYQTTVCIDDHEFTMKELGQLLSAYNGWGMRPPIEIKEPDHEHDGALALSDDMLPDNVQFINVV